jgi:hypothetical protein
MKKNLTKIIGSIVVLTILFSSCQIEKRHYTSGYNVKWFSSNNHSIAKNNLNKPATVSQINPVKTIESSHPGFSNQTTDESSLTKTREINQQSSDQNKFSASANDASPLILNKYVDNNKSENITSETTALNAAKSMLYNNSKNGDGGGDHYFFKKWIIFALVSLLFFILAGATLGSGLAWLFWIAGFVCLIIAVVYFIRWIDTV